MKGYATQVFNDTEFRMLDQATQLVAAIPEDFPPCKGNLLRCHELARAVGKFLNLPVVDGHYGRVEHSWLWTKPHRHILDVYAVGRYPMVLLVDYEFFTIHRQYKYPYSIPGIDREVVSALVDLFRGQDG